MVVVEVDEVEPHTVPSWHLFPDMDPAERRAAPPGPWQGSLPSRSSEKGPNLDHSVARKRGLHRELLGRRVIVGLDDPKTSHEEVRFDRQAVSHAAEPVAIVTKSRLPGSRHTCGHDSDSRRIDLVVEGVYRHLLVRARIDGCVPIGDDCEQVAHA